MLNKITYLLTYVAIYRWQREYGTFGAGFSTAAGEKIRQTYNNSYLPMNYSIRQRTSLFLRHFLRISVEKR